MGAHHTRVERKRILFDRNECQYLFFLFEYIFYLLLSNGIGASRPSWVMVNVERFTVPMRRLLIFSIPVLVVMVAAVVVVNASFFKRDFKMSWCISDSPYNEWK